MLIIFGRTFTTIMRTFVLDMLSPDPQNILLIESPTNTVKKKIDAFKILFLRSSYDPIKRLVSYSFDIEKSTLNSITRDETNQDFTELFGATAIAAIAEKAYVGGTLRKGGHNHVMIYETSLDMVYLKGYTIDTAFEYFMVQKLQTFLI